VYDSPEIQYDWEKYTCGAKIAGHHVYSADQIYEGDARILLDWLFYHDALARFSTRHWLKTPPEMEGCTRNNQIRRAVLLCGNSSKV
jgi:hypothetical protein